MKRAIVCYLTAFFYHVGEESFIKRIVSGREHAIRCVETNNMHFCDGALLQEVA